MSRLHIPALPYIGRSTTIQASRETALEWLRTALDRPGAEFRPGQWEAIDELISRRARLLVVQRTGWGKSLVYFLATKLLRLQGAGPTLLISPLLSLMRNQILAARNMGIRADTINSANQNRWPEVERRLRTEETDVLLISPERLANEEFIDRCLMPLANRIGLLVVDEAHCISDWGHDFRPDYQRIVRILQALPRNIPVLATTATANDRVVEDIVHQLGPRLTIHRGPLTRASLQLQNINLDAETDRLAWLAQHIPELPGSGIVYTLTVENAERVAAWLRHCRIEAAAYHAKIDSRQRETLEDMLLDNQLKVLVATVALGMGFDKPDLGFVIHFQHPHSLVHYYQQVGRAGRAVDHAFGILLSGVEDDQIADYFIRTAFPSSEQVETLLAALGSASEPMTPLRLQDSLNLSKRSIDKILRFLAQESPSPIQRIDGAFAATPIHWDMPTARIARITRLRRQEQERMREYLKSKGCLMQFLSGELNDRHSAPCGKCMNCHGELLPPTFPNSLARLAEEFLDRIEIIIEPKKHWPNGLASAKMQGDIAPRHRAQAGRALCRWGDPGSGELVRQGKREKGRFDDALVEAAARLIRNRWRPAPAPQWVTCVPSHRSCLVPDFAKRLARRLELPFIDCVRKIRETPPQKTRENTFQQAQNLAEAFAVRRSLLRSDPVLLIDDVVDSGWTLTVVSAALRHAGAGLVHPFALADTSIQDGV